MTDLSESRTFASTADALRELQTAGFRLWQWLDGATAVWWAPGRRRFLLREMSDGTVHGRPLPPIEWDYPQDRVGTVARTQHVAELLKSE